MPYEHIIAGIRGHLAGTAPSLFETSWAIQNRGVRDQKMAQKMAHFAFPEMPPGDSHSVAADAAAA